MVLVHMLQRSPRAGRGRWEPPMPWDPAEAPGEPRGEACLPCLLPPLPPLKEGPGECLTSLSPAPDLSAEEAAEDC